MRPRLCLLFKVLLCFLLLYCLRDWIVIAYRSVLEPIGFLLILGSGEGFKCGDICSLRIVAYLSLVISTPNIRISWRLFATLIGLTVFICIDLAGFYLWPAAQPLQPVVGETFLQLIYGFVWTLLGDLLLPFLLWVMLFDRHLGLSVRRTELGGELKERVSLFKG